MTLTPSPTTVDPSGATRKEPTGLAALLLKWFLRSATVTEVQALSDHFRLLTLAGEALKGLAWVPGQKVQIMMDGGANRTYTPITWDAAAGVTRLLVYLHGPGPSTAWATALKPRDPILIFGPRASLDLSHLARPAFLFGDETSFALAHALKVTGGLDGVTLVFEVASVPESQAVLHTLGLTGATLIQRSPNAAHLAEVEAAMRRVMEASTSAQYVLTGSAASILPLRQALRTRGLPAAQLKVKAYWAAGKKGLD